MSNNITINEWIKTIFEDKISESIIAINFGFFESEEGNMIYCVGSTEYDEEDPDWACNEDFVPTEKYFTPAEELMELDWEDFDSRMGKILEKALNDATFIPSSIEAICCGFDDGDLTVLWTR